MRELTNIKELKHPCLTRFASKFKMLESIIGAEIELRMIIASSNWRQLEYNKKQKHRKSLILFKVLNFNRK